MKTINNECLAILYKKNGNPLFFFYIYLFYLITIIGNIFIFLVKIGNIFNFEKIDKILNTHLNMINS